MIRYDKINLDFDRKTIFNDFSFKIAKGEKVVLLGKSGLGKSSLFGLILGFIQPKSGKVLFDGAPVDEHTVWHVRQNVAFVDQDVSIGDYKVSDWFSFVAGIKSNHSLNFGEERINELMDFFELSHVYVGILNHYDLMISKLFRGDSVDIDDCKALIRQKNSEIDIDIFKKRFLESAKYDNNEEKQKKTLEYFLSSIKEDE